MAIPSIAKAPWASAIVRRTSAPRAASAAPYANASIDSGIATMAQTSRPAEDGGEPGAARDVRADGRSSPSARARASIGKRMSVTLKRSWYGRNAKVWHSL